MGLRTDLKTVLESALGSKNVYFQPPPSFTMSYPCIVFERSNIKTMFSGNRPYNLDTAYSVTLMDRDPDSPVIAKLAALEKCTFDRHFTTSGINHDVFLIYY